MVNIFKYSKVPNIMKNLGQTIAFPIAIILFLLTAGNSFSDTKPDLRISNIPQNEKLLFAKTVFHSGYFGTIISWINNNSLVFLNQNNKGQFYLIEWSPGFYEKKIHETIGQSFFCISDHVLYSYKYISNQEFINIIDYKILPPKSSQEVKTYQRPSLFSPYKISKFTCERIYYSKADTRDWLPLSKEHGVIDFGPNIILRQNYPPKNHEMPISIVNHFSKRQILLADERYLSYSCSFFDRHENSLILWQCRKYFQPSVQKKWKVENCLEFWFVNITGDTKAACLPFGPWSAGGLDFMPTKKGLFISSPRLKSVYIMQEKKVTKILDGVIEEISVSPNGCKVAFTYTKSYVHKIYGSGFQIAMIDLCNLLP